MQIQCTLRHPREGERTTPPHHKTQGRLRCGDGRLPAVLHRSPQTGFETKLLRLSFEKKNRDDFGAAEPLGFPRHPLENGRHGLLGSHGRPHLRQGDRTLPFLTGSRHPPCQGQPSRRLPRKFPQLLLLPLTKVVLPPGSHGQYPQQLVSLTHRCRHFTSRGTEGVAHDFHIRPGRHPPAGHPAHQSLTDLPTFMPNFPG